MSNSNPIDNKMMRMIFELFFMIFQLLLCWLITYDLYQQDLQSPWKLWENQFTTAIQKEIYLVSRLHLKIIWEKCKVKESNCISPDSPNAILHYNKWFCSFWENWSPDSFITHSRIFQDLDFHSKSYRSKLNFFRLPILSETLSFCV